MPRLNPQHNTQSERRRGGGGKRRLSKRYSVSFVLTSNLSAIFINRKVKEIMTPRSNCH